MRSSHTYLLGNNTSVPCCKASVPGCHAFAPDSSAIASGSHAAIRFFVLLLLCVLSASPVSSQHVSIGASGAVNLGATSVVVIPGSLSNQGSWSANSSSSTLLTNTIAQDLDGTFTFGNLAKSGGGSLSLQDDIQVNGILTLSGGTIVLGAQHMTLGSGASIAGSPSALSMLVPIGTGELRKLYSGTGAFTFPVGDLSGTAEYSPVTLNFTTGTFSSAYAAIRLTNAKHTNNASSSNFLDRYWTVTCSGISAFSCAAAFTYVDADINGNESLIYSGSWNGSNWTLGNQTNATTNQLSMTVSAFSDFTGGEAAAVPVELTAFSGRLFDSDVYLKWSTATELNSYGFEVQRQIPAAGNSWQKIAAIRSHGTSNTPHEYSFTDEAVDELGALVLRYRLKLLDRDGSFAFSSIVEIRQDVRPLTPELLAAYPNPAISRITIPFVLPGDVSVTIKMYDILGAEALQIYNDELMGEGYHAVTASTTELGRGMYILVMSTPDSRTSRLISVIP